MGLYRIVLLLSVLTSSIAAVSKHFIYHPTICVKETLNDEKPELIKTKANDFKNLVRDSDIFVDKSLLVNLVTQNASLISLTYPKKFGKTVNLGMIRAFLEIEIDHSATKVPLKETWSYRFFKYGEIVHENGIVDKLRHPPMIAQNERLINSHLGRYPVIYVDLSAIDPVSCDFDQFLKSFRSYIAAAYERHYYMIEVYRDELDSGELTKEQRSKTKKLLEKFKRYIAKEVDSPKGVITSLEYLSSVLRSYFNQRVYILIDDYDAVLFKSCFAAPLTPERHADLERKLELFFKFMSTTFETNDNLQMGIVTGVFDMQLFDNNSRSFKIVNYNILSKNTVPFYGFTSREVKQLASHCSVNEKSLNEAFEYYDGYHMGDLPDITVYDPSSIVNFLNNRKIYESWCDTGASEFLPNLLSNNAALGVLKRIIFEYESVQVPLQNLTFNRHHLTLLAATLKGAEPEQYSVAVSHLFYVYLYALGFFTINVPTVASDRLTGVKLKPPFAGNDIAMVTRKLFEKSIETELAKAAGNVAPAIHSLLFCNFTGWYTFHISGFRAGTHFYNTVVNKIERQRGRDALVKIDNNSILKMDEMQLAHFLLLLYLKTDFNCSIDLNVTYLENGEERKPYIFLQEGSYGGVIEYECGGNEKPIKEKARAAVGRAMKFDRFSVVKHISLKHMTYIGIHLTVPKFEFDVSSYMKSW